LQLRIACSPDRSPNAAWNAPLSARFSALHCFAVKLFTWPLPLPFPAIAVAAGSAITTAKARAIMIGRFMCESPFVFVISPGKRKRPGLSQGTPSSCLNTDAVPK
jgi:hypothetical protein